MGEHWVYTWYQNISIVNYKSGYGNVPVYRIQNRNGGTILMKQYKYYMLLPSTRKNSTVHREV
jgi:hypothetical protein